jgi:beta-lactamase regulating signal transducer with metallopeptidase domain
MMDAVTLVVTMLASFFFHASLKTALVVGLVLLVQKCFSRILSASGHYLLWTPVVISMLTPVGFDIELPLITTAGDAGSTATARTIPERDTAPASQSLTVPRQEMPANTASLPSYSSAESPVTLPFSWSSLLSWLWTAGVLTVLGMVALSSYRFLLIVRRSSPAPLHLQHFLETCMQETSCNTRVSLLHSHEIAVPMVAGLFRPVLLLPAGLDAELTPQQLRHVVVHELMHLKRLDIPSNWFMVLLQALHWFNPAVWLAFSLMRHDRELACDAATLLHLAPADRAAYGHTLLQLSAALPRNRLPATALGILDNPSQLRRRILMLVQTSRSTPLQSSVAMLLVLLLSAAAFSQPVPTVPSASLSATAPVPSTAPSPAPVASIAPPAQPPMQAAAPLTQEPVAPAFLPAAPAAPEAVEALPVEKAVEALLFSEPVATEPALPPLDATATVAAVLPAEHEPRMLAAAVASEQPPSGSESIVDLAAIEQLTRDINVVKEEKLRYIDEWNSIAADCESRRNRLLGGMSKPCRQVRMAVARGEVLEFGLECYTLTQRHDELLSAVRAMVAAEDARPDQEAVLAENARNLATFCSKDTYETRYPAFAGLLAQAESHRSQPTTSFHHNSGFHEVGPPADVVPNVFAPVPATTYESQSTPVFTTPY